MKLQCLALVVTAMVSCSGKAPAAEPVPASEERLYLDIWSPGASTPRRPPVMVWIYGGDSPSDFRKAMTAEGSVVVTFNYRLGSLGIVALPHGVLDMIAALKWIEVNIAARGAEPRAIRMLA